MNDDTKFPTTDAAHAAGVAAVWQVANEAGPMMVAGEPDAALIADVQWVDSALRALAASESPDAIELRRMRDAAIRTTRLHALEAMNRRTLSPQARRRSIPKWSIGVAAAAVVAVGFFTWVANSAPSVPRTIASVTGNTFEERQALITDEITNYGSLVKAFTSIELPTDASADTLDELDHEVDVLSLLGERGVEASPSTGD